MADEEESKKGFDKGERAAIVEGSKDVGVRGVVFWIGENKYGPGTRYGLRGDDGETYWVDESNIGPEDGAPPEPERPAREALNKGDRVEITGGREGRGKTGEIFWVGESKYGKGMRYGVRAGDEETYWADEADVTKLEVGGASPDASAGDDAPLPSDDDVPPPAMDDAPLPGDDDAFFTEDEEIPF